MVSLHWPNRSFSFGPMFFSAVFYRWLIALSACAFLSGCFPAGDGSIDEEKDPNFVEGQNRVRSLDYKGAIESFEKALQTNPRSAAAHFELGYLNEEREHDFSAAIYHYERHLRLRPESPRADVVRQHITACKLELAKTANFSVVSGVVQRDLERLSAENTALRQQIDALKIQLAQHPSVVTQFVNLSSGAATGALVQTPLVRTQALAPAVRSSVPTVSTQRATILKPQPIVRSNETVRSTPAPAARGLKYTVRPNDSMASIARTYGVSLQALRAANRGLDANRLRQGQTIIIPTR